MPKSNVWIKMFVLWGNAKNDWVTRWLINIVQLVVFFISLLVFLHFLKGAINYPGLRWSEPFYTLNWKSAHAFVSFLLLVSACACIYFTHYDNGKKFNWHSKRNFQLVKGILLPQLIGNTAILVVAAIIYVIIGFVVHIPALGVGLWHMIVELCRSL